MSKTETGSEPSYPLMIAFDPERYSPAALALILSKAEEWQCSPMQAEVRLLDELAEEENKKGAA